MNIKNISRLLVKVLELNPKNYYLVHNKQITSNIKLDGLVAKSEYSYEYTEQPQIRVRREFSFPELKDKAGIFVIEFFGNGRQSRVIIKKGSLRYISRPNAAGEFMYVMNEDNIICKENAGVYIDSRFYEARQEDGRIDVPFARTSSYKSIILTDGVIAELCSNFFHTSENYKLETAFLIHKEQLLSATHTSIYLRPKLYVNNIKAPDSLLKDCRAVMNIMNIDGSGLSKTYSDFVVSNEEIELAIEVPSSLSSLEIFFTCEVESIEGDKISLESDYSLNLNTALGTSVTFSAFLRMGTDGFIIEVLGRNGEPIGRQRIDIVLNHSL